MEYDLENPFTSCDEAGSDSVSALFAAESYHWPTSANPAARRDAVSLVLQHSCNVDPTVAYLAVNYADRFLSKQEIPRERPWVARMLAIACLSLASKMKHADLSLADLQAAEGFIFDTQTIHRMELLVLRVLDWRMRSITPFSFLRFFLGFFSPPHPQLLHALKARVSQTLFSVQNEMKMLEFKPSLIAAAALLSAAAELFPVQLAEFRSAISSCEFVNKERLWECCKAIGEAPTGGGCDSALEMASNADTPATVFGPYCTSSESERTGGSSSDDQDFKRRRKSPKPFHVSARRARDRYNR